MKFLNNFGEKDIIYNVILGNKEVKNWMSKYA